MDKFIYDVKMGVAMFEMGHGNKEPMENLQKELEEESNIRYGKPIAEVEAESHPTMSSEEESLEVEEECPFCGSPESNCVCEDDMSGASEGER